jgi:hypothetical protein
MHLIDQVRGEELADRRWSSADAHVKVTSQLACELESLGWSYVDEVERRPALHLEHGPDVVSEHHDGRVERRVVAPPALPLLVCPGAALMPELVTPHDLRTDTRSPLGGEGIVDAPSSTWLPLHGAEGPRRKKPLVQPVAGVPEGGFKTLPFAGAETIE